MNRILRLVLAIVVLCLAGLLIYWILALHGWGGRVETQLLVFGDRVWLTFDAGRPRLLVLILIPVLLGWMAVGLWRGRPGT
jgi:hypothetical protein